jgi:hypothetical protein
VGNGTAFSHGWPKGINGEKEWGQKGKKTNKTKKKQLKEEVRRAKAIWNGTERGNVGKMTEKKCQKNKNG